jgi:hypothetical protein
LKNINQLLIDSNKNQLKEYLSYFKYPEKYLTLFEEEDFLNSKYVKKKNNESPMTISFWIKK